MQLTNTFFIASVTCFSVLLRTKRLIIGYKKHEKYLNIGLQNQDVKIDEIDGEDVIVVGRHLIAKILLEKNIATVDPLSPDNPLIFSAGPFAGSNFSNANRLSVGCKSPLTGGIKERMRAEHLFSPWANLKYLVSH